MIVAGSASPLLLSSAGGYNLTNSLRFRSSASAYLNRTPSTAGNSQTWTWSGWVKLGTLDVARDIFSAGANASNWTGIDFRADGRIQLFTNSSGVPVGSIVWSPNVYRDPSAWYHFVIVCDTTNATQTSRFRLFVNGVQVTGISGTGGENTWPAQNATTNINTTVAHSLGRKQHGANEYFDGYITEVNFVDGQALNPSSFGSFSSSTGVWQPRKYVGTYGTNGFYLPFSDRTTASFAGSFNGSNQSLSLAQNAAFSFGTGDFTVETFVNANSWGGVNPIIALGNGAVGGGSPVYTGWAVRYDSSGSLIFFRYDGVETTPTATITLATGQWYHIAVSRSSGTLRMFVNGIQVYSAASSTSYNNVNSDTLKIGGNWVIGGGVVTWVNGQISNTRIVKGTGLYTANFTVPTQNLTAVSGTSLLTLQNTTIVDNSTNNFTITNNNSVTTSVQNPFASGSITSDQSGNANNWFSNNINTTTLGTTYDSMTDVPTLTNATTANYCVLNPLDDNPSLVLTNGNLNGSIGSASWVKVRATFGMPTGKWYFEYTPTSADSHSVGIMRASDSLSGILGAGSFEYGYWQAGYVYAEGSLIAAATYTTNDVIGITFDAATREVKFYKNNTLQVTDTVASTDVYFPTLSVNAGNGAMNFGQRPFAYTPPTGFVALNTFNLPTPTIGASASTLANNNFNAVLYAGNSATQAIGGLNFQPDLVWTKSRSSNSTNHLLTDVSRGVTNSLMSNNDTVQGTRGVASFNSNGFTYIAPNEGGDGNVSGQNYVGWCWKANGAPVTNTAGSITSQVSANTSAGFSIVRHVNTGSAATIGHGLGVAPRFIINRVYDRAENWRTYFGVANQYVILNATNSAITDTSIWNNTQPTSSVFSIGAYFGSGDDIISYCFTPIANYSAFGSYTGNGSTDGPFVFTGFRPRFIMVKNISAVNNWWLWDSARNTFNAMNDALVPNLAVAEQSPLPIDFVANGIKFRTNNGEMNGNGNTYIYMAFAENPFKYANAR